MKVTKVYLEQVIKEELNKALKKYSPLQESISKMKSIFIEASAYTADGRVNNPLRGTYVGGKEYNPNARYDTSDYQQAKWDAEDRVMASAQKRLAAAEKSELQKINQMLASEIFNPLKDVFSQIEWLEKYRLTVASAPEFKKRFTKIWNLHVDLINERGDLFKALQRNSSAFYRDTEGRTAEKEEAQKKVAIFQQKMKMFLSKELPEFLDFTEKTFGKNKDLEELVDDLVAATAPVAKYLMSVVPKTAQQPVSEGKNKVKIKIKNKPLEEYEYSDEKNVYGSSSPGYSSGPYSRGTLSPEEIRDRREEADRLEREREAGRRMGTKSTDYDTGWNEE